MYRRLRPEHPVMKKLEKLFAFMADEGITLGIGHDVITVDIKGEAKTYSVFDNESHPGNFFSNIYSRVYRNAYICCMQCRRIINTISQKSYNMPGLF